MTNKSLAKLQNISVNVRYKESKKKSAVATDTDDQEMQVSRRQNVLSKVVLSYQLLFVQIVAYLLWQSPTMIESIIFI